MTEKTIHEVRNVKRIREIPGAKLQKLKINAKLIKTNGIALNENAIS